MGLSVVGEIAEGLVARGKPPETPIAVIANGASPEQKSVVANLRTVAERVATSDLASPALIVMGEVVRSRAALRDVVASVGT